MSSRLTTVTNKIMSEEDSLTITPPPSPRSTLRYEREESKIVNTVKKPNVLKYIIQSSFGMLVLIFAAVQIMLRPEHDNSLWVGLICTIVGVFLPHPTPGDGDKGEIDGGNVSTTTHTRSRPTPMGIRRTRVLSVNTQ